MTQNSVCKVRIRKNYAEATNHVVVGEVLEMNDVYLKVRCKTYHFRRPIHSASIQTSDTKVRIFPWSTIAYITELPEEVRWENAEAKLDKKGDVVLEPADGVMVNLKETLDS